MVTLTALNKFLTKYMNYDPRQDVLKIDEKNANGMQYRGAHKIEKIAFGVSASEKLFKGAKSAGAQALVVHHGIRYPEYQHYYKSFQERYSYLVKNDVSLFGYHFLMDSHPEIGHNSQTLKDLGIKNLKPYEIEGANWGWMGKFSKAKSLDSIVKKCKKMFMREVSVYDFGNDKVKTAVSVSGGGAPRGIDLQRLVEEDVDLYITGTARESSREMFREIGCNMIVGGHYATERIGVLALMERVKKEFKNKVETEFIELWNEV